MVGYNKKISTMNRSGSCKVVNKCIVALIKYKIDKAYVIFLGSMILLYHF